MVKRKHKEGDIIWFKKPDIAGFQYKKLQRVTPVKLGKIPVVKPSKLKWVKYW